MPQPYPHLFDSITGDLLPEFREQYLQGRLAAGASQAVEEYLKSSPVQTSIVLGRYHELAEAARRQRRSFTPPQWVQHQLVFQTAVSKGGPLRRPVVRAALGMLLALCVASIVQWIRNEPLVPAPVAAAVVRAATTVQTATRELAHESLVSLHLAEPTPAPVAAAPKAARKPAATATEAAVPRPAPVSPAATRAVAVALPDSLPASLPVGAATGEPHLVEGRIYNQEGEPLAGATVLLVGSTTATSTNAEGKYVLKVPAGAMLQFGYAGYVEKLVRSAPGAPLNVILEENGGRRRAAL